MSAGWWPWFLFVSLMSLFLLFLLLFSGSYTLTSSDPSVVSVTLLAPSSSSPPLSSSQLLQPLVWSEDKDSIYLREQAGREERGGHQAEKTSADRSYPSVSSSLPSRPRFRIETSSCSAAGVSKKRRSSNPSEASSFPPCYATLRLEDALQPRNAFDFFVVVAPVHKVEVHVDSFLIQQAQGDEAEEREEREEREAEARANRPKMKAVVRKVKQRERADRDKTERRWRDGELQIGVEETGSQKDQGKRKAKAGLSMTDERVEDFGERHGGKVKDDFFHLSLFSSSCSRPSSVDRLGTCTLSLSSV